MAAIAVDAGVAPVLEGIAELAVGGKRVRAVLCELGWRTATQDGDSKTDAAMIRSVGVALELFHLGALIHDDIMDDSVSRRGVPTIHTRMAGNADTVDESSANRFGSSSAILAGDLCFGWAAGTFTAAVASAPGAVEACAMFDAMRSELMVGQYLDVASDVTPTSIGLDRALKIARLKTARYSVDFPLQIGAHLGSADRRTRSALSQFAVSIGEAYQLRDDVLGVFGSSAKTGKSAEEDLVNAKNTALWCEARARASDFQLMELELLARGDATPERIDAVRGILVDTGAADRVEELIDERYELALEALALLPSAPPEFELLARELAYREM